MASPIDVISRIEDRHFYGSNANTSATDIQINIGVARIADAFSLTNGGIR